MVTARKKRNRGMCTDCKFVSTKEMPGVGPRKFCSWYSGWAQRSARNCGKYGPGKEILAARVRKEDAE